MLVATGTDFQLLQHLAMQYNALLEEKFVLIDRLKNQSLYTVQRIHLRLQLAELHHHIIRTDSMRNAIAFGWKHEITSDLAISLRDEIERELEPEILKGTQQLADTIYNLNERLRNTQSERSSYRIKLYEANVRLAQNGLPTVQYKKEDFNFLNNQTQLSQ